MIATTFICYVEIINQVVVLKVWDSVIENIQNSWNPKYFNYFDNKVLWYIKWDRIKYISPYFFQYDDPESLFIKTLPNAFENGNLEYVDSIMYKIGEKI